jgi:CBS domain-containing protein
MLANEVMTRDVVTVSPQTALTEAAKVLVSACVSSVPVVDAQGKLVGIVSEGDLIHRAEIGTSPHHAWWQVFSLDPGEHATELLRVHGARVGDVMTRQVVTANEQATLRNVVDMFDRFGIDRIPIVRDGAVVGIVARRDVLRLLGGLRPPSAGESRTDEAIAKDLDALLADARWATVTLISAEINHGVKQGVVQLSGIVGNEHERSALIIGARNIPGVTAVEADELAVVPRDIAAI